MANKKEKSTNEKNKEAYKKNKKKLKYILGHSDLNTILSPKQQEIVKKAFALMQSQMDVLVAEKAVVQAKGKEKSLVKEALNLLLNTVINASISPILKDLALEFGLLAHNWNKKFGKRPDIDQVVNNIGGVISGNLSLIQSISIIKELTRRFKDLQRFIPPGFELSRAYLESLKTQKRGENK